MIRRMILAAALAVAAALLFGVRCAQVALVSAP